MPSVFLRTGPAGAGGYTHCEGEDGGIPYPIAGQGTTPADAGVDIWAAEIVLERKKTNPEVRLICALPYPDFEKRWNLVWQERYKEVIARADLVKVISLTFSMVSFQRRNEWMVDHSAK